MRTGRWTGRAASCVNREVDREGCENREVDREGCVNREVYREVCELCEQGGGQGGL